MHSRFVVAATVTLGSLAACGGDDTGLPALPPGAEAISLRGDTLRAVPLPEDVQTRRREQLDEARQAFEANPGDPDALIWLGRRTAYLGQYREAIEIFTRGIEQHPDDARMYRHRGHRYITVRLLDRAVADLEQAAALTEGQPDEVEPDGLPNPRNIPTSTLQSNIWYHLGLAYYLKGDFESALRAYRKCVRVSANPDMQVATSYWLHMTLNRLGRHGEAAAALDPITADMDIIENQAYHRLLLLFKGELPLSAMFETSEETDVPLANATVGYGVGSWQLFNGREEEAGEVWRRVLGGSAWAAFGYIAAEAELARSSAPTASPSVRAG